MNGWFIASTAGECSDCGKRTGTNARVRYPAHEPDDVRLCESCGQVARDLLDVLAMTP